MRLWYISVHRDHASGDALISAPSLALVSKGMFDIMDDLLNAQMLAAGFQG
eukprot:CAMPEP_0174728166 /NCGR_PEP_ID=MMETSP1094-20130205/51229_1 /TAXON_ID=156173 /ORGANISM="Chrysochromulina brevifilum, Strain UTEX LB 985" /LENGTH=50 /DNA_ID=CAMNT_0015930035 /DNA_START=11 /DNA_END=163 /DNA_ORIENTATION=+